MTSQAPFSRAAPSTAARPRMIIKPPALKAGATIGLISPGGVVDDALVANSVKNLEALGFKVRIGKNIHAVRGGYAGTIAQRLEDLHAMFADRDVHAIWTARGGSGCTGLLPFIDYALITRHPKILIGYSDITALHLAIHRMTGLVTFHGPVAASSMTDYSLDHALSVLTEPVPEYQMNMSIENDRRAADQPQYRARTLRPGVAEGRLTGGNLSMLCALIGTPFAADIRKHLLFLEDVGEAPYRIDRMLTQLDQSAGLAHAAGAMLGVFERTNRQNEERGLSLDEVIDDHFASLNIPSVYGYSFGHIRHQLTLPIGIRARLDTGAQTLTLLEPAVRHP